MARTNGALLSLDARGTIGKTIVYNRWNGHQRASLKTQKKQPRKGEQVLQATSMFILGGTSKYLKPGTPLREYVESLVDRPSDWQLHWCSTPKLEGLPAGLAYLQVAAEVTSPTVMGYYANAAENIGVRALGYLDYYNFYVTGGIVLECIALNAGILGFPDAPSAPNVWSESEVNTFAQSLVVS